MDKNELRNFSKDKYNNELFGEVIRHNQKTATIKVNEHNEWLVHNQHCYVFKCCRSAINRVSTND